MYVIIPFCDSMCFFSLEANLCWFFILCLYLYCRWRSSYQEGRIGISQTCLTPSHFYGCPRTELLTPYVDVFFAFDGFILLSWRDQYWSRNCPPFRSTWVHPNPRFQWCSCCSILSLFAFCLLWPLYFLSCLNLQLLGYPLVISNFSLRWEAIVTFVDIGWILDQHCLSFLFKTQSSGEMFLVSTILYLKYL